jgi:alpha-galactosidase
MCGWSSWYAPHGAELAHAWRISADCDEWANVYIAIRTNERLTEYAGAGGFNDPDMLLGSALGATHLTPQQSRAQFAMWAVMTVRSTPRPFDRHFVSFDRGVPLRWSDDRAP